MFFLKSTATSTPLNHIFITGASSGIGRALAVEYAAPNRRLFLCGRHAERLNQTADTCRNKGALVQTCLFDVTDCNAANQAIRMAADIAPLDLIIVNAGISCGSFGAGDSQDSTRAIFSTNIGGVLNTALPALECFKKQGHGQLAIMSSVAGFLPLPSCPAYSASKACIRYWGESIRPVYAPKIKINIICPGFVKTPLTDANHFPMPLMIQPDKAAKFIVDGLRCNHKRIVFPASYRRMIYAMMLLPEFIRTPILNKMPKKEA